MLTLIGFISYYIACSIVYGNVVEGVQVMGKSWVDCDVGNSQDPKICDSEYLNLD